jgi:hypothetical protein
MMTHCEAREAAAWAGGKVSSRRHEPRSDGREDPGGREGTYEIALLVVLRAGQAVVMQTPV